jgi:hypothetical protein
VTGYQDGAWQACCEYLADDPGRATGLAPNFAWAQALTCSSGHALRSSGDGQPGGTDPAIVSAVSSRSPVP